MPAPSPRRAGQSRRLGYHGGHDQVRCLKLNRFTRVEELPEHSYEIPKDFSLKAHFGNAWRMIKGDKTYKVHLLFDAQFAEGIADTHWHDTQEIDERDDGSLDFRCKVDGLDEIVWWVLSMGPHCQVIEPKELAERVRKLAAETAGLYAAKE
jgi:predicted DNA-binding transcriptional regulator YafY